MIILLIASISIGFPQVGIGGIAQFAYSTLLSSESFRVNRCLSVQCMRNPKELLVASKAFTSETKWISWWHLLTSITCYTASLVVACSDFFPMILRIVSSCVSGLVVVRLFIIYHDFNHGAILRKSWLAATILKFYGLLVLSPSSVWTCDNASLLKSTDKSPFETMPTNGSGSFANSGNASRKSGR